MPFLPLNNTKRNSIEYEKRRRKKQYLPMCAYLRDYGGEYATMSKGSGMSSVVASQRVFGRARSAFIGSVCRSAKIDLVSARSLGRLNTDPATCKSSPSATRRDPSIELRRRSLSAPTKHSWLLWPNYPRSQEAYRQN